MYVLGLQGSPRLKGNTHHLLSAYLDAAQKRGAQTQMIQVTKKRIEPCIGCMTCEEKGFCAISGDDMSKEIYFSLRRADVVVLATPIYFYNATAQLKTLIDRTQTLWARKYRLGLTDPGRPERKGVLLAVGATKGKNLFEGMTLTARYFFDAIGARFYASLTYRQVENIGDMKDRPEAAKDIQNEMERLAPMFRRKKILFLSSENACRSQMACAFTQYFAGDRIEAESAGVMPAAQIDPLMEKAMAESGLDVAFRAPCRLEEALSKTSPEMIITFGCENDCPNLPGVIVKDWDIPNPAGKPIEEMRTIRDEIEKRVKGLISSL